MEPSIIDRVQKLLALAEGTTNEHEAAAALAQANKLMQRHNLSRAMVDAESAEDEDEQPVIDRLFMFDGSKIVRWQSDLASALAGTNRCKMYITSERNRMTRERRAGFGIIGTPTDASAVRYMFTYIVRQVNALCDRASEERGRPGRTWCNNYKTGMARELSSKIYAAWRATHATMIEEMKPSSTALARIDNSAQVKALAKTLNLRARVGGSSSSYDPSARDAGRRDAAKVNMSTGNDRRIGAGAKRLGGGA